MKRLNIVIALLLAIFFTACEEEKGTPVLTDYTTQAIVAPAEGASIVITKELLDSNYVFTWDSATYSLDLINPSYTLEMDEEANSFEKPKSLATTSDLMANVKYSNLNKILLDLDDTLIMPYNFKIRVTSNISGALKQISQVVSINITPYIEPPAVDTTDSVPVFETDTIYLVGSATLAGWNANLGLPIICPTPDSVYKITTELITGGIKILKYKGLWAPQWGDDGSFSGLLKYRPTETVTDPPEIPSPGEGTFDIVIDIPNLTYTITPI
jgi:starch-binding outer membrane protein SusE/F